jgi:Protein of unknown function (DUF3078)
MRVLAILSLLMAATTVQAQEEVLTPGPWNWTGTSALNLTQSTYTQNWAGGDRGQIAWVLNLDMGAVRQFNRGFNLANSLKLAYGQTSEQNFDPTGDLVWDHPDKSTDQILFESLARFTGPRLFAPYASLRLESQFRDESYGNLGALTLNPVKLKEAVGLSRMLRKTEDSELLTRFGFGARQTFGRSLRQDASTLAIIEDRFTSNDGGFEWQTDVTQPMFEKKIEFKAQLLVFQPVFYSKAEALEDYDRLVVAADPGHESVADFWKSTDVNLQSTLTSKITKYLQVVLFAQLIYDKFDTAANVDSSLPLTDQALEVNKNVRKAGQFKQTLALGLTYTMF